MENQTVKTSRSIGWVLLITGLSMAVGAGLYAFVIETGMPLWQKFMVFAIYGGLAVLLYSVWHQRLIERKTDKYKDVGI